MELVSLDNELCSLDSNGSSDYTAVEDGESSWRCEGATRVSLHLKDSMSVVSDISADDFDDDDESDYVLDDMHHLDARGCDSEFEVTSTDDDFTYLSFVSDDYFDLEEALDEEEEEEASIIDTPEETKRNLKQVACRPIQTQMLQNSLDLVSWHNRDESRKRQACAGVSPTYKSLNNVSWHNRDELRKRQACAGVSPTYKSLNTVSWHNRDELRKRQAFAGVSQAHKSLNNVSRPSTARSKIRLPSRSLSVDTKVRLILYNSL
jgi:hypothetical protein